MQMRQILAPIAVEFHLARSEFVTCIAQPNSSKRWPLAVCVSEGWYSGTLAPIVIAELHPECTSRALCAIIPSPPPKYSMHAGDACVAKGRQGRDFAGGTAKR
jgi:hypothetical protein